MKSELRLSGVEVSEAEVAVWVGVLRLEVLEATEKDVTWRDEVVKSKPPPPLPPPKSEQPPAPLLALGRQVSPIGQQNGAFLQST